LQALNTFLLEQHALGRNAVLIVDEAQALGPAGLEAVRLLSNLETERNKLLQIVLFGQSELDELLQRPDLRQVNQRIGFSFNTGPLTMAEAVHYIRHRVHTSRVDGIEFPVFSDGAMATIARSASFVPRVINILADKSLLAAYGDGAIQAGVKHAAIAIDDTGSLVQPEHIRRPWIRHALTVVIAAEIAALIALFAANPQLQSWAREKVILVRTMLAPSVAKSEGPDRRPQSSLARSQ
jgi:MSHA biogenesis protein MshM